MRAFRLWSDIFGGPVRKGGTVLLGPTLIWDEFKISLVTCGPFLRRWALGGSIYRNRTTNDVNRGWWVLILYIGPLAFLLRVPLGQIDRPTYGRRMRRG